MTNRRLIFFEEFQIDLDGIQFGSEGTLPDHLNARFDSRVVNFTLVWETQHRVHCLTS